MDIIINIYFGSKQPEVLDAKIEEVIKTIKAVTKDIKSTPTQ